MAKNDSFKQAIKAYLDKRAEEDSLFAPKYANEKKSIDECCSYIMGEARKRGNAIAISDEEVYGMAAHYYDEDDIKINRLPAGEKASVSSPAKPVELTEEDELASFILSEIKKKGECVYFHYGVGWGNNWPHCWAKNTGSDAKDRHQISELAHDNVIRAFIDKGYSVEYRSEIAAGRYVIIRG
jgi:hypothetical protein